MRPVGVILAGGASRRMGGGDKGLIALGGRPMLALVADRLADQVAAVAINANGDPARFDAFGLPVVADSVAGLPGPLAGVLAGMDWARARGASHLVTVAADTPFFPSDLVARLIAGATSARAPIALAATPDGLHPTFGLWPVALRDDLAQALHAGTRKLAAWAEGEGAVRVPFAGEDDPFFNINTPEDLECARARLAGGAP